MRNSRGNMAILLSTIIVAFAFCSLAALAILDSQEAYKNLQNQRIDKKNKIAALKKTQTDLAKLSKLIGFYYQTMQNVETDPKNVVYFLDVICSERPLIDNKVTLGLNLRAQKIDKHDNILKGKKGNPGELKRDFAENITLEKVSKGFVNLEDVWTACVKRVEALMTKEQELLQKLNNEKTLLKNEKTATKTLANQLRKDIENQRQEIEKLKTEHKSNLLKAEKKRKLAQKQKLEAKYASAEAERKKDQIFKKLQKIENNFKERIKELQAALGSDQKLSQKQKVVQAQELPDGEILYVNYNLKIAYIDLGKKDGLQKGMSFRVFRYGKGGTKKYKGLIIVNEVQNNMSKVSIQKTNKIINPITKGDKIINKVFDKNRIKYFVIAGEPDSRYSIEQLRKLVEQTGGRMEPNITPKTDIVVLAKGFLDHPIYQTAQERGIETILEPEFLEYLTR